MAKNPNVEPEDDFTVDDLDPSTLSDQERAMYDKLHKRMRDAYLKKTSTLAEKRQSWEREQQTLQSQLAEKEQQLNAVREWWQREGQYMTPRQQEAVLDRAGIDDPSDLVNEVSSLRTQLGYGQAQLAKVLEEVQSLRTHTGTLENALRLQTDLFDLRLKHSDLDPLRVLNTAREKGLTDLGLAYNLAYGDEIKAREVEEKVNERVEAERSKLSAERDLVETKPASTKYAPPTEAKSYSEASANLLGAVRKSNAGTGGATGGGDFIS